MPLSAQEFRRDDKTLSANERSRALSISTDTSVASILSNSDRLIPDLFQPVDIQILSAAGQRRSMAHHSSGSTPSKSASLIKVSSAGQLHTARGSESYDMGIAASHHGER
ncbi:hypothetical protein PINS_up004462 [Pythium insidiosum]|nr:hypothetical protein PINS_up004462 [Pythium insidiosum]